MPKLTIEIEGSRNRTDSPDPTAYDVANGMKVVRERSPEWG